MTEPVSESGGAHRDRPAQLAAFGLRIKTLRAQAGLRQSDLADRAGIDRIAISQIERGQREVGITRVQALADALGVPVAALFDDPQPGRSEP